MRTVPYPLSQEEYDKLKRLLPSTPRQTPYDIMLDQPYPWDPYPVLTTESGTSLDTEAIS